MASAYNSTTVSSPESRRFFTLWLPAGPRASDGWVRVQRKRMPFGWINSGSFMNAYYNEMVAELPQSVKGRVWPDISMTWRCVGSTISRSSTRRWNMLLACIKYGLFLNVPKTTCGLRDNNFYGFKVSDAGGAELSERNVAAIKALKPPTSVGEVQALIGLWTQSRRWVPQCSSVVAPLTDLIVKGVKWRWGSKEQAAFEAGRDALVTSTAVYRPTTISPSVSKLTRERGQPYLPTVPEPRNIGLKQP